MQTRTIIRPNQDCSNFGFVTSDISQAAEGNIGSYRLLKEIYQRICIDYSTHGKVIEEGSQVSME
jgi:hypothetical protein